MSEFIRRIDGSDKIGLGYHYGWDYREGGDVMHYVDKEVFEAMSEADQEVEWKKLRDKCSAYFKGKR